MRFNIMYGVLGLFAGIFLTWIFAFSAVNNQNAGMMRIMGLRLPNNNVCMMTNPYGHS